MTRYAITPRAGIYRIEVIAPTGRRWVLSKTYPSEDAALVRLRALQAMAAADEQMKELRERRPGKRGSV
jgi:hypothetical protein